VVAFALEHVRLIVHGFSGDGRASGKPDAGLVARIFRVAGRHLSPMSSSPTTGASGGAAFPAAPLFQI